MITPMQMYWLLKLDDIRTLCAFLIGFAILAIVVSLTAYQDKKLKKIATVGFLLGFFGLALCGVAITFMPSTKQMAAIYVVPAIANNEKIQQIGGKTLDISNQLLDLTKKYFESKVKEK